eukprot:6575347-Prymnesium_polylepis.1
MRDRTWERAKERPRRGQRLGGSLRRVVASRARLLRAAVHGRARAKQCGAPPWCVPARRRDVRAGALPWCACRRAAV